jgi:hypothetical protein
VEVGAEAGSAGAEEGARGGSNGGGRGGEMRGGSGGERGVSGGGSTTRRVKLSLDWKRPRTDAGGLGPASTASMNGGPAVPTNTEGTNG